MSRLSPRPFLFNFEGTDLFEQIFKHILEECYRFKLVDPTEVFVDATHVKARANNKKMQRRIAQQEALFYKDMLRKEIASDRAAHGKKPLKDKDDDDYSSGSSGGNNKFEDYTDVRQGAHDNEGCAYICMHEFKEACKKNSKNGI